MNEFFLIIDYVGTISLAITGASIAASIGMDLFGIIFLAFLTAVGGGTLRDIILNQPVFWTKNSVYFFIVLTTSPIVFIARKHIGKIKAPLFFLDTIGLGFYAIVGSQKAINLGFSYTVAFIMGITTGVLGGIIRSLFSKELSILYSQELYATIAALASLVFLTMTYFKIDNYLIVTTTIIVAILGRYLSVKYNIKLPSAS